MPITFMAAEKLDCMNEMLFGLVDMLSQIQTLLQDVTHGQSLGLLLVMIILPAALLLLSYIMYLRHYKLDEPEYDRICAELKERRAHKKA